MENGGSFHKKMWSFPLNMVIYPFENMGYPLVNQHNYGKSPFLMGKSTVNGYFQ
jgi:hypothetical protein